jgi:hypothetical protein
MICPECRFEIGNEKRDIHAHLLGVLLRSREFPFGVA